MYIYILICFVVRVFIVVRVFLFVDELRAVAPGTRADPDTKSWRSLKSSPELPGSQPRRLTVSTT